MSKKKKQAIFPRPPVAEGVCFFCEHNTDDPLHCGKLYSYKDTTVHYYCLLFASALSQRGEDSEGIQGFLLKDIAKEQRRGSRLTCTYCNKKGATIGCVVPSCKLKFHFPCGKENGSLFQFFGHFSSFCKDHRPQQELHGKKPRKCKCPICMMMVDSSDMLDIVKTPCCKNSWLHRDCVQNQALNAGYYFFRCPICNNRDQFLKEMQEFGIYVPEQDASWELEENAFQELLERHSKCDAANCVCPDGRQYSKNRSKWEITICHMCGSAGTHMKCSDLKSSTMNWTCDDCKQHLQEEGTATQKMTPPSFVWRITSNQFHSRSHFLGSATPRSVMNLSPPTPGTNRFLDIAEMPHVANTPVAPTRCTPNQGRSPVFNRLRGHPYRQSPSCAGAGDGSSPTDRGNVQPRSPDRGHRVADGQPGNNASDSDEGDIDVCNDDPPRGAHMRSLRKLLFEEPRQNVFVIVGNGDEKKQDDSGSGPSPGTSSCSATSSSHEVFLTMPNGVGPASPSVTSDLLRKRVTNLRETEPAVEGRRKDAEAKSSGVDVIFLSSDDEEETTEARARPEFHFRSNPPVAQPAKKFIKSTTRMSMKAKTPWPPVCRKHRLVKGMSQTNISPFFRRTTNHCNSSEGESQVQETSGRSGGRPEPGATSSNNNSDCDVIVTECRMSPDHRKRLRKRHKKHCPLSSHKRAKTDGHSQAKEGDSEVICIV